MDDRQHGLVYRISSRTGTKPVTKLTEGGNLITTHNPHYLPPSSIPGYGGHCPGYNFRSGKTHSDNFCIYQKDKREDTFRHGFRMRPGTVLSYSRKPLRYLHRNVPRLTNVNYGRYQQIFNLYEKAQDHRDNYRDLTGTVPRVAKFKMADRNRDAAKPIYPLESYYLHHNRDPDAISNYFDRFHPAHLYAPRRPVNYDANPLKHVLHSTQ